MNLLISLTSGLSAAAVISSEQLDSWGELGAVAILGLVCIGFGFLHWQDSKLHAKSVDRLAGRTGRICERDRQGTAGVQRDKQAANRAPSGARQ